MSAKEGSPSPHLKKLYIAAAGLATVAAHYIIHIQTKAEVHESVKAAASEEIQGLRRDIDGQKLEHEKDFVRRADLEKIARKMEDLSDNVGELAQRHAELEGYLRGRDRQRTEVFWQRALKKR